MENTIKLYDENGTISILGANISYFIYNSLDKLSKEGAISSIKTRHIVDKFVDNFHISEEDINTINALGRYIYLFDIVDCINSMKGIKDKQISICTINGIDDLVDSNEYNFDKAKFVIKELIRFIINLHGDRNIIFITEIENKRFTQLLVKSIGFEDYNNLCEFRYRTPYILNNNDISNKIFDYIRNGCQ